ncbi:hypothetical protein C1I36_10800 [Dehalobacter sp. 14DCB1]|nr:hypothetical protein C1I36_10800 [Dehalobacter sp. 14DCB1]
MVQINSIFGLVCGPQIECIFRACLRATIPLSAVVSSLTQKAALRTPAPLFAEPWHADRS